jgi:hypothetical protein
MLNDYIARYLDDLAVAMVDDDPALRQDALHDAEVHLRAEFEEGGDAASIMQRYGTPAEIAASYRTAEALIGLPTVGAVNRRPIVVFFSSLWDARAWSSALYLLLSLVTGTAYFSWVVTGISLSLGLAVLVIGIPMMILFLSSIRGLSLFEGRLVEALLGERMPRRRRSATESAHSGFRARITHWLRDRRTWTSIAYMVLMLPLGIAYFTFVVMAAALSAGLVTAPFFALAGYEPALQWGNSEWDISTGGWFLAIPLGILILVCALHLCRAIGALHARYSKYMLVGI